jgi:hypothetical protein
MPKMIRKYELAICFRSWDIGLGISWAPGSLTLHFLCFHFMTWIVEDMYQTTIEVD